MRTKDLELEKLLEWLKKYDLTELTVKLGRRRITLKRDLHQTFFPHQAIPGIDQNSMPQMAGAPESVPPSGKPGARAPEATPIMEDAAPFVADLHEVKAPLVGTFYRAPAPDAEPFVEEGDLVEEGDKLCIVEAMKIMNEIESPVKGIVREICIKNGTSVEFGQVLFRIEVQE